MTVAIQVGWIGAARFVARWAWKLAPVGLGALVVWLLWFRPSGGGGATAAGVVQVAGKEALTREAEKWDERTLTCPPVTQGGQSIKIVYRDVPPEELERLAKKYATTVVGGSGEVTTGQTTHDRTRPTRRRSSKRQSLGLQVAFGEYNSPVMPYGGTFLAGIRADGEFETRFAPAPAPRFRFTWVYGAGAFYDLSSPTGTELAQFQDNRVYAFVEPFQTRHIYWRLEGGAHETPNKWEPYFGVKAEFRSDAWIPKSRRGLRAVLSGN